MDIHSKEIQPASLRGWILKSLEQGELLPGLENVLLKHNKMEVNQRDETEAWDYKENIDLDNPLKVAQLAKWILAFHNAKGGAIIFGVTDKYKVVGIHESKILDTVKLKNLLKKYIGLTVSIFQGRIETHDYEHRKNVLWLIFIPKRTDEPVAVAESGPYSEDGKQTVQKGQYYIRIQDESKLCSTPNDFERLFSGITFKSLSAYSYEVDEPYFRLLAPHQSQFIGRQELLEKVKHALDSRSYIISLDGVGGVGKSALAIELIRQLYKAKTYDFIVSLSAKNKIWSKHSEVRQANFSGFTELITEIADVLEIEKDHDDINDLKNKVINFMKGTKGLLLIDNIEEIDDSSVFDFLKYDIPEPVKIIVTSRVSRGLPAETILILGMTEVESLYLLQQELERIGYKNYINEIDAAKEILKAAGYLPLAIKWAASLAIPNKKSLHEVSSQLRKHESTRREFLDFCFATMYDELSDTARDVALLCPYLREDWNTYTISIALDKPVPRIESSINELEDRGILTANKDTSFSMLPLTMDFLSSRWHENKIFRENVEERVSNSFASDSYKGNLFNWPVEERIKVLLQKSKEAEKQNDFEKALKVIKLALRWELDTAKKAKLRLIEGNLLYKSGRIRDGIELMQNAISQIGNEDEDSLHEYIIIYAEALLFHGKNKDQNIALEKIARHIRDSNNLNKNLIQEFCGVALRQRNYSVLSRLMENNKTPNYAYWIIKEIWLSLNDSQIVFYIGEPLIKSLRLSLDSEEPNQIEKNDFSKKANEVKKFFSASSTNR